MRAAVVTELGKPLTIQERPVPVPGKGQILVRMEACGVCHTDIHAAHGDWPAKPRPPFVPGHEGVGTIEEFGPGEFGGMQIGMRVAIPWLASACGVCRYCVAGWETLCESQRNTGFSVDGAYSDYAAADARFVVPVPSDVSALEAAPLTCAGVTTYKAVRVAGVRPAERVAVFGVGGLGHMALQYAKIAGAFTVGVDVSHEKLQMAVELGADSVTHATEEDPVAEIKAMGGADVAIVTTSTSDSFAQAYASLRRGGRLVCVGLPPAGQLTVPIFDTVISGKTIIGSIVGTRNDLADVFRLHSAGRTEVITTARKLDDINDCFADVLAGRVRARLVLEF